MEIPKLKLNDFVNRLRRSNNPTPPTRTAKASSDLSTVSRGGPTAPNYVAKQAPQEPMLKGLPQAATQSGAKHAINSLMHPANQAALKQGIEQCEKAMQAQAAGDHGRAHELYGAMIRDSVDAGLEPGDVLVKAGGRGISPLNLSVLVGDKATTALLSRYRQSLAGATDGSLLLSAVHARDTKLVGELLGETTYDTSFATSKAFENAFRTKDMGLINSMMRAVLGSDENILGSLRDAETPFVQGILDPLEARASRPQASDRTDVSTIAAAFKQSLFQTSDVKDIARVYDGKLWRAADDAFKMGRSDIASLLLQDAAKPGQSKDVLPDVEKHHGINSDLKNALAAQCRNAMTLHASGDVQNAHATYQSILTACQKNHINPDKVFAAGKWNEVSALSISLARGDKDTSRLLLDSLKDAPNDEALAAMARLAVTARDPAMTEDLTRRTLNKAAGGIASDGAPVGRGGTDPRETQFWKNYAAGFFQHVYRFGNEDAQNACSQIVDKEPKLRAPAAEAKKRWALGQDVATIKAHFPMDWNTVRTAIATGELDQIKPLLAEISSPTNGVAPADIPT